MSFGDKHPAQWHDWELRMKKERLEVHNKAVKYFVEKIAKWFKTEDIVLDDFAYKSGIPLRRFDKSKIPDFMIHCPYLWIIGEVENTKLGYVCFVKIVQAKENPNKHHDDRDRFLFSQSNFVLLPYIFPQFTRVSDVAGNEVLGLTMFEEDTFSIRINPQAIWNSVDTLQHFIDEINLTILHELFHTFLDSSICDDVVEHMVQVLSGRK